MNILSSTRPKVFRLMLAAMLLSATTQLTWLSEAHAEPTQAAIAAARKLFTEAFDLEQEATKEKDPEKAKALWRKALSKLQRVSQVKMTPQVRYHIALCHEQLGKWVKAINGFERAAQEAREQGKNGAAVVASAPGRAKKLRERVAHLTLRVEGTVHTSKIVIDGKELPMALVGTDIPLDPGEHTVSVMRGKDVTFEKTLQLAEKQSESLTLTIDDPEPVPEPVEKPAVTSTQPATNAAQVQTAGSSRLPAYIIGGAGLAALGASAVTFGLSLATIQNVRLNCDEEDKECDPDDKATAQLAEQYVMASRITLGVGAGLVATGTALWFILGSKKKQPEPAKTGVWLVPTGRGAALIGRF